jgi:hypothetical protein
MNNCCWSLFLQVVRFLPFFSFPQNRDAFRPTQGRKYEGRGFACTIFASAKRSKKTKNAKKWQEADDLQKERPTTIIH